MGSLNIDYVYRGCLGAVLIPLGAAPGAPPDPLWYGVSQVYISLVFELLKSQILGDYL